MRWPGFTADASLYSTDERVGYYRDSPKGGSSPEIVHPADCFNDCFVGCQDGCVGLPNPHFARCVRGCRQNCAFDCRRR